MHTKTMEGLIGARTNMELLNTPFRVYKEARLKGDTAVMEQAMGYMGEAHANAYEYKEEADEGMKKDAEESRKIAEKQRIEMIKNRREEREEQQRKLEEERKENKNNQVVDTVEISEEGRALLKGTTVAEDISSDGADTETEASSKPKTNSEPAFYASVEEVKQTEDTGTKISALV